MLGRKSIALSGHEAFLQLVKVSLIHHFQKEPSSQSTSDHGVVQRLSEILGWWMVWCTRIKVLPQRLVHAQCSSQIGLPLSLVVVVLVGHPAWSCPHRVDIFKMVEFHNTIRQSDLIRFTSRMP